MTEPLTRYEALIRCRDAAGSDSALARGLNVTQPRVWRWVNQSKQMPGEYVRLAERLYGVAKEDLRPDLYPREIMADEAVEDRFCGIDLRRAERREAERRVA
jgi:DNA-binding transcriptional regulator YdaS (Cro superfamily)